MSSDFNLQTSAFSFPSMPVTAARLALRLDDDLSCCVQVEGVAFVGVDMHFQLGMFISADQQVFERDGALMGS